MCKCRPEVRTPFCGREGCKWPTIKAEDKKDELVDFFCRLSGMERAYIAKFINTKLSNLELVDIERVHTIFVNDNSVKMTSNNK